MCTGVMRWSRLGSLAVGFTRSHETVVAGLVVFATSGVRIAGRCGTAGRGALGCGGAAYWTATGCGIAVALA
jgi:hypothetical protein